MKVWREYIRTSTPTDKAKKAKETLAKIAIETCQRNI